jgi:hypothetical protein
MRKIPLFVLAVIFAGALSARAQDLLPDSFGGWKASIPSQRFAPFQLAQLSSGDAAILQEYGVQSAEQRTYAHGAETATVTLYRHRNPSAAYGLYTFYRSDALTPVEIGSFGCASRERALIIVGNFLMDVSSPATRPADADLQALASVIVPQADSTPFPTIGEYLPQDGLVHRSERYVVGPQALSHFLALAQDDWVGFDFARDAIVARYNLKGANGDATLFLISYQTPQIAALKFDAMLRRFPIDPPEGAVSGQTVLYGKRASSLVALVSGAPSRAAADALLDRVSYQSQVTWNEPHQKLTDPSLSTMVVGAIIGTGTIMLLAIVAGIGFGGFRIIVKFFLPGKVFDREKQVEILQLGISSKPIQAKDFY